MTLGHVIPVFEIAFFIELVLAVHDGNLLAPGNFDKLLEVVYRAGSINALLESREDFSFRVQKVIERVNEQNCGFLLHFGNCNRCD